MTDTPPTGSIKPPSRREDALAIVRRLREAGQVAYFAGGCVRDQLLGLTPKDYDVATDAPPQRVRQIFANTQAVGQAFGVILVRLGQSQIEVATFRTDLKYTDGRRPEGVIFTTAEEDAKRRDFTINGLFLDPIENKVIDYVGGQDDLRAKILRAIGEPNHRFEEDHLRLLRAVRFAARFGLTIEPATAAAIARHAEQLKRISPERIAEELRLMLPPPTRVNAWRMLWDFQLLQVILRSLPELPKQRSYDDKYSHPLFPSLEPNAVSFPLALASLVVCYRTSDYGGTVSMLDLLDRVEVRRSVQACRTTLRISNAEADAMTQILSLAPLMRDDPPTIAVMKRFMARSHSMDARRMLDALLKASSELTRILWLQERFAELEKQDVAPPPLITGEDLIGHGLTPGKLFKQVLDEVYDAQLEDRVSTRENALELALKLAQDFEDKSAR